MHEKALLIDKSAFQNLSRDEAAWMSGRYLVNTVPILVAEILGDLAKSVNRGNNADAMHLARKFGGSGHQPNVHFHNLCFTNLMGNDVPMNGQIPIAGGIPTRSPSGDVGFVYDTTPMQHAIMRWANGTFTDLDRQWAAGWRKHVGSLGLLEFDRFVKRRGVHLRRPKSDTDLPAVVGEALAHDKHQEPWMLFVLDQIRLPKDQYISVRRRWNRLSPITLEAFAPYAHFCLTALLYVLILWKHKMTKSEPNNLIDAQYLFYLPFCHVFVSRDKLHKRLAPLLMRPDQEFLWGDDLKKEMVAKGAIWRGEKSGPRVGDR